MKTILNEEKIHQNLKNELFELIFVVNKFKRKEIIEKLVQIMTKSIDNSSVTYYINNRWMPKGEIIHSTTSSNNDRFQYDVILSSDNISKVKDKERVINIVECGIKAIKNKDTYLLQFSEQEKDYGTMLLSIDEGLVTEPFLEKIQIDIKKFLRALYNTRNNKFISKRNQFLFELASEIHAIHDRTEILEAVLRSLNTLYSSFTYSFLVTYEQDSSDLPIKKFEYNVENAASASTRSFINNELIIEHNKEEKTTKIYTPLTDTHRVYGVFQINIPKIITLTKEEKGFLDRFSIMVGRALEKTALYETSNRTAIDLQIINDASRELNENLERNKIMKVIKKYIIKSCGATQTGFIFNNAENSAFDININSSTYFHTEDGIEFSQCIFKKMKKKPEPILIGEFKEEELETPYHSLMIIPLYSADNIIGTIVIMHSKRNYFSFKRFRVIQSLVQHASLALTNASLKEKLNLEAITDYLTKLYRRSYLDSHIKKHMETKEGGALLLLDIDDFKEVNDTYGHYIGDKVLIQISDIIRSEIYQDEIGSRWGGEEFAIYLKRYTLDETIELANNIRSKVKNLTDPQVTVSVGISTWSSENSDTIESLFIRTDKGLYDAKTRGKNQVSINELCET